LLNWNCTIICAKPSVLVERSSSSPGDAREAVLEPVDHLALDLLGRRARVGDADEDDRRGDVGELVGVEPEQGDEPEHGEREHRDDRDDRPPDGEVGDEHGGC
jgi:hypothetical protein